MGVSLKTLMQRVWIVALLGAGPVMWSPAADHRFKPEQAELLKGARQHPLHYSASLPDFLSDQIVRRSEDARGDGRRRQLDTLKIKVTYFGHILRCRQARHCSPRDHKLCAHGSKVASERRQKSGSGGKA
jgi:hypothetical protein